MEGKLPWWFWFVVVAIFGGVIAQIIYPKEPIMLIGFIIVVFILVVLGLIRWGWGFAIALGIIIAVAIVLFGCNAIASWGAKVGSTWPTPDPPTPTQAWAIQTIGWPSGIYLFLIAAGLVTTWMLGTKGIWSLLITTIFSCLGALLLGQVNPWLTAAIVGFFGALLSLLTKLISKPAGGAAPLVMAGGGLVLGAVYLFVAPLQSWIVLSLGLSDPIAGITAIVGYSTGAGIFSTLLGLFLEA